MKRWVSAATAAVATTTLLLFAACGTAMPNVEHTGFLSNYQGLETTAENTVARIRTEWPIDPASIRVTDIAWRVPVDAALSDRERADLLVLMRNELVTATRSLPATESGRAISIRAAITRVETVSPALNTVGTLLFVGPLDRGGMAVEIEAVDSRTGRQLAGLRMGSYVPLNEFSARFSKLAPAEIAMRRAAREFALLLRP